MAYVLAIVTCYTCGRRFGCNPNLVPSVRVSGVREPVCADCVIAANELRRARGMEPIVPRTGAYEPADEGDIAWEDDPLQEIEP